MPWLEGTSGTWLYDQKFHTRSAAVLKAQDLQDTLKVFTEVTQYETGQFVVFTRSDMSEQEHGLRCGCKKCMPL